MKCGEAILDPEFQAGTSVVGPHRLMLCEKWISYYDFNDYEVVTRPYLTFICCLECFDSIISP